jgi:ribosome recycling factor
MESIIKECESKMDRAYSSFQKELSKIRGGAVSKSIFDDIKVDYYGAQTPLNQLCNINTNEASTIFLPPMMHQLPMKL